MLLNSENINEIATALAKAQGEMKAAAKDSLNPHFKSRFASLSSVWDACREALSKNGLAVVQQVSSQGENMILVTTLTHSSGQFMRSYLPLTMAKSSPQALGSALSYARRYGLSAMVGIVSEDCDDGEAATRPMQQNVNAKVLPGVPELTISQEQCVIIDDLLRISEEVRLEAIHAFRQKFGSEKLCDIPSSSFPAIVSWLNGLVSKVSQ